MLQPIYRNIFGKSSGLNTRLGWHCYEAHVPKMLDSDGKLWGTLQYECSAVAAFDRVFLIILVALAGWVLWSWMWHSAVKKQLKKDGALILWMSVPSALCSTLGLYWLATSQSFLLSCSRTSKRQNVTTKGAPALLVWSPGSRPTNSFRFKIKSDLPK